MGGYKKHDWTRYGSALDIIEINVFDSVDRRKLDFFRCNNNKDFKKIMTILKMKYGFKFIN